MIDKKIVVAISARALFDMEESHNVFLEKGIRAYLDHHSERFDKLLKPGAGFPFIKAISKVMKSQENIDMEIIIVSNIHPEAGIRVIKTIDSYSLPIKKFAFTGSSDILPYLKSFQVDLYLSKSEIDSQRSIDAGIPAATLFRVAKTGKTFENEEQIRIAFDGDAVIFSDESECIYKRNGIEAFQTHELRNKNSPLKEGPFAKFLKIIQSIQDKCNEDQKPFRLALVTARGSSAIERVLITLKHWNVRIDEAFFLSGMQKSAFLQSFKPHIFFDDQDTHIAAAEKIVPSAKVPYLTNGDMDKFYKEKMSTD